MAASEGATMRLPGGTTASMRIHRTGSVEAMIGGNQQAGTEVFGGGDTDNTVPGGSPYAKASPASPVAVSTPPAGSPAASHFGIGDLAGRLASSSTSPGAAYLGSSGLAHSVLASSSFSSNIHNSRAVLAALRALQDKIRALETDRSKFSHQCGALQVELASVKEKLATEQGHSTAEHLKMKETAAELAKRERDMEVEEAKRNEKISALTTEMTFVKEQAQLAAVERRSAIDTLAKIEVAMEKKEKENQDLRESLAREEVRRRTAEDRVAKLNELADRLISQNEELSYKLSKRPRFRRTKKKKKSSKPVERPMFGSRGRPNSTVSRSRQEAADRERSRARKFVNVTRDSRSISQSTMNDTSKLSLKEQVRLANLGKDPPFMPSGNPDEEFNIYGVTQKQLADPMAYGIDGHRTNDKSSGVSRKAHKLPGGPSTKSPSSRSKSRSPTMMSARSSPVQSVPAENSSSTSMSSPHHENSKAEDGDHGGLGAVVTAIRNERDALTLRRDTLLKNAIDSPDGRLNIDQRTIDIALADLQKKIHNKTRQLDLLEAQQRAQRELNEASLAAAEPPAPSRETQKQQHRISPVRDHEASNRKKIALELLQQYKHTTEEQEFDTLNELHGRSLAAAGGTQWVDYEGDIISSKKSEDAATSQRRGTYFGTYSAEEVARLRGLGRTSSSLGIIHKSLKQ